MLSWAEGDVGQDTDEDGKKGAREKPEHGRNGCTNYWDKVSLSTVGATSRRVSPSSSMLMHPATGEA